MATDFEAEGLLEGLDGQARAARRELLERLEADGLDLDELRGAVAEGRLALLPVERVLAGGDERFTAGEIAQRTGLDPEFLARLWSALGMAAGEQDARIFTREDADAAQRAHQLREAGMGADAVIEITRVMSRAMFGVAATIRNAFADAYLRPGDDELSLALRFAEASRELTPLLGPTLEHVLAVQQRSLLRQAAVEASALAAGRLPDASEVAICFADLVGFTKLGERVEPSALGDVAGELEQMAHAVAEPPVRLIKTIGDAAMLQSSDPGALLDAALALVARADERGDEFPQLRAGVASGAALERAGDWYGRPVNLASRITGVARPGSVLVAEAARDAAGRDDYSWSFAGARKLKGVDGEVKLFRVRPSEPADG
jgi:adenylate cyclase